MEGSPPHDIRETPQHSEAATVRRVKITGKKGSAEGSTASRTKAVKIAKAKEELLRLRVELATALLTILEAEDSEGEELEEVSVCSKTEVNERIDSWLDKQEPQHALVMNNQPEVPEDIRRPVQKKEELQESCAAQQPPAGDHHDYTDLANAIALAVRAGQRHTYVELPYFGGSHQEWLPFRAAYYETQGTYSPVENVNRLRRNLKKSRRGSANHRRTPDDMKTLEIRFGRPEVLAMMQMEALRELPRLNGSPRDICIFSTKISNIVATLKSLNCVK